MAKTKIDPNETFMKMKSTTKRVEQQTEPQTEQEQTVVMSVSLPKSTKMKLDRIVFERKQAGESTSVSDIVRKSLDVYIG